MLSVMMCIHSNQISAQSLLLRAASVGAEREKTFVKQEKRTLYLGRAVVNSVLARGESGCFRGIC